MPRNLVNLYLTSYARKRIEEIKRIYSSPLRLQENALRYILNKAKLTEFGKEYDFKSIKSIKAYQKRLPLFRYDDIKDRIEKAVMGRPNVLWPGRIWDFALTSGTAGKNKHIPLSRELIASNRRAALDCLTFYLSESRETSLLEGKFLFLGGSTSVERLKSGTFAGDLSGLLTRHLPFFFRFMYEPDKKIALMSDWLKKIDKIAHKEVNIDIRGISGMPAWLLVFFNKLLEEASKRRNRSVGTVSEVWPGLSLLVHGGVNFKPFRERFRNIIGKDIYYLNTYPASEAFIAIQDKKDEEGLLLMLDYGIFYEFVPAEDIHSPNPPRLTIADVETGKNYAIILTTNSGLFSYIIGDTVRFTCLNPPRLVVTGRIENFLSAFGEHLIVEEAEAAVDYACKRTGSEVEQFTAAPFFPEDMKELPYHQWLIEFRKEPRNMREFTEYIDAWLRNMNADYDHHRGIGPGVYRPRVIPLKKGTFYNWMKSEGKIGGQHKVPRLKNDRSVADKLLQTR